MHIGAQLQISFGAINCLYGIDQIVKNTSTIISYSQPKFKF